MDERGAFFKPFVIVGSIFPTLYIFALPILAQYPWLRGEKFKQPMGTNFAAQPQPFTVGKPTTSPSHIAQLWGTRPVSRFIKKFDPMVRCVNPRGPNLAGRA